MKKGYDLLVLVDGTAVASSTSCNIDTGCETKEAMMSGSGKWKRYIAGRKYWSISTSFLVGDSTTIKSLVQKTGTTVTLKWKMRKDDADSMSGKAIIDSCKISGARGSLVKGSFSFKGTGELA